MLSFSQAPGMIEYSAGSFIDLEIFTTNKLLKLLRCLCCWYFSLMDWSLDRHPVKYNIIYDGYHKFIICNVLMEQLVLTAELLFAPISIFTVVAE